MYIRVSVRLGRHLRKCFAAKLADLRLMMSEEHVCGLCVAPSEGRVDPSEWSYYALIICAVAAAWKLENPPKAINSLQRLTALAGRVVSEKCKSIFFNAGDFLSIFFF